MNRNEWKKCTNKSIKYYFMNKVRQFLKSGKFNLDFRTDENAKVIHHLRDTEEQRKYNNEHYELWGFEIDENGNEHFEYGKYVVFWTKEHHDEYHAASDETNLKRSNTLKKNPPFKGRHHTEYSKKLLSDKCSGWHHSNDIKATISECTRKQWQNEDFRSFMHKVHSGVKRSEECINKIKLTKKRISNAYKLYKESGGNLKWNEFQKLYKENESLYNAYTQKDVVVRPEDILNLSQFNNEDVSMYNYTDETDEIDGIKRVSIDKLDDISNFINTDNYDI